MNFFLLALILIIVIGIKIKGPGEFNKDYLEKKNTTAINGIFVILVVFSHYAQYADLGGIYDRGYLAVKAHLSQMIVASFLFYSGYGMMESLKKKGCSYILRLPVRFLKLLFKFDCAVLLFILMNMALGITYPRHQTLFAFTGWESIGNSNWYIFDILILYMLMLAAFSIASVCPYTVKHTAGVIILTFATIGFIIVMRKAGKDAFWYNTLMLFPAGAVYSLVKHNAERLVMRSDFTYFFSMLVVLAGYLYGSSHRTGYGIQTYIGWSIMFMLLLLLITMKVSVYNGFLEFLGRHVFSIYILQRIPMTILSQYGYIEKNKYACLIAVMLMTIVMALAFERVTDACIDTAGKLCGAEKR